ncbi:hypothetical protein N665_0603s0015 [Sinapis alba]|nr:hypothetical protein N665_0603s0015 [Sinapis alba]
MEGEENDELPCQLPERYFIAGEEPTGVRVTPYHKASGIKQILNALDADEVEMVRLSPFGKLVEIADKPPFSGRFGRYIISRQLKIAKKHEAWFLYAGKPIRFSLREFALVTGLNCKKFPKRSKKRSKNFIAEKPYWGELFGTLKEVPVHSVVRMLKKKTVTDKEVRIKYAYLSLLASVILPTTHAPRISQDHAELIKDLDVFFAYPWGRVSFDMLMSSIKERKEVSLSQNTIALKGFVLSLQLVIVEAVPALTEAVRDSTSSGSEGDSGDDDDNMEGDKAGKRSISPSHARDTDAAGKAAVQSVLVDVNHEIRNSSDLDWSDDDEDPIVENMLKLIEEGYSFKPSCFLGGASREDVCRMREEARTELQNRKTVKTKLVPSGKATDVLDAETVACIVRDKLKEDISLLQGNMSSLQESLVWQENVVLANFKDLFRILGQNEEKIAALSAALRPVTPTAPLVPPQSSVRQGNVVDVGTQTMCDVPTIISEAMNFANRASQAGDCGEERGLPRNGQENQSSPLTTEEHENHASVTDCNGDANLDPALVFPNPSFSLGVTQEGRLAPPDDNIVAENEEALIGCRKSKRLKLPTKSLLGQYQCDRGFINRARQAAADSNFSGGNIDYSAKFSLLLDKMKGKFCITTVVGNIESTDMFEIVERTGQLSAKVVDVLIFHIGSLSRSLPPPNQQATHVFLDTQFVSQFMKMYSKFSKVSKKECFKFTSTLVDVIQKNPIHGEAERFYMPFYLDKKYWVGISIDCSSWTVSVLDCNNSLRTDNMMNKEVKPIAQMFPYLLKQIGKSVGARESKPMGIDRPRSIPQHNAITDSAVASVLFIQAHAVAGVDGCKCITPDVLDTEVERLVVTLYEGNLGPL